MSTPATAPSKWTIIMIATAVVALVAFRYVVAVDTVGHVTALRTYAFWALAAAPVAVLADVLVRTVLSYRVVQLAVARVRSDDRRSN